MDSVCNLKAESLEESSACLSFSNPLRVRYRGQDSGVYRPRRHYETEDQVRNETSVGEEREE
jgi:hypothetical protein